MVTKLKSFTDAVVLKIARKLPRFNPNFITIAGLVPPILFFWLLTHHYYDWALLALVGTLFDSLDGAYARATGQTTKFGAFLDSTLDRFSDAVIIAAFGFAGLISWELVTAILIASFLISYIRSAGMTVVGDSKILALGPIERAQRLAIVFLGLLLYWLFPTQMIFEIPLLHFIFILLLVGSAVTVWRRINAVSRTK
jgi:archaetidylinositol phosphate synthase